MAWVWSQCQSNSWEILYDESQDLKIQSETILDGSLKHWCQLEIDTNKHEDKNLVYAIHREEDEIYPLTTIEIAISQQKDQELKILTAYQLWSFMKDHF